MAHNTVQLIFGQDLRRFIDYRFQLPQPSAEKFSRFLFDRFNMWESLKGRRNPNDGGDTLIRVFINLARRHKFSLRVIEQCFTEMNLVLRTIPNNILLFPEMLAFLVALKNYSPKHYLTLRHNLTYGEMKDVLEFIKNGLDLTDRYEFRLLARIHANLVIDYLDRYTDSRAYDQAIKDLKDNIEENVSSDNKIYTTEVLQILQNAEHEGRYRGLKFTLKRLDLVESLIPSK